MLDYSQELLKAARNGDVDCAKVALQHGVDINIKYEGATALHWAAWYGHDKVVKLLLDRGAKTDIVDTLNGITALHYAAANGHDKVVELLLDRGANIDAVGVKSGVTALRVAVEEGHDEVVGLLLDRGANINITDNNGYTAYDIYKGDDEEIRDLLKPTFKKSVYCTTLQALLISASLYAVGHYMKESSLMLQLGLSVGSALVMFASGVGMNAISNGEFKVGQEALWACTVALSMSAVMHVAGDKLNPIIPALVSACAVIIKDIQMNSAEKDNTISV